MIVAQIHGLSMQNAADPDAVDLDLAFGLFADMIGLLGLPPCHNEERGEHPEP